MVSIYLAFILKKEKRNSQNNTTPIYIRLIRDRKKAEARLDIEYDLTEAQVSKWNAIYQRLAEKNSSINNYLDWSLLEKSDS